jgi:hypothetical protein
LMKQLKHPGLCTRGHRDGRSRFLKSGAARVGCPRPPSTRPAGGKQSRRKFTPSCPKARAKDAEIQISRPGSTFRFHPLSNLQNLQYRASPRLTKDNASLQRPRFRGVVQKRVAAQ